MRRLIIDTDTASDDAVAIMMALAHPAVRVEAITVVAGNVALAQASINARFTVELSGSDVPVHEGCDRPWLRAPAPADWFHGADGMGDVGYPAPSRAAAPGHAAAELVRRFAAEPGQIELVTIGPLTNVATALALDPAMASNVRRCWVMGGAACTHGNVTAAAEYNVWCDPEAAARVLDSGMDVVMLGWELSCGPATLDATEMDEVRALGTRRAEVAMDCNRTALEAVTRLQGQTGLALADPVAMAVVLDDRIATERSRHRVDVALGDELVRGMTVVDRLGVSGRTPNAEVVFAIDAVRWKALLRESLSGT